MTALAAELPPAAERTIVWVCRAHNRAVRDRAALFGRGVLGCYTHAVRCVELRLAAGIWRSP